MSLSAAADGQTVTMTISPVGSSGISGTAALTDIGGGKTRVDIHLNNAGAGPLPAHFHQGTCSADMSMQMTPEASLTSVVNGASSTDAGVPFAQLTSATYVLLIHKSPDEIGTVVACGTVGKAAALPSTGAGAHSWGAGRLGILASVCAALVAALGISVRRWLLAPRIFP